MSQKNTSRNFFLHAVSIITLYLGVDGLLEIISDLSSKRSVLLPLVIATTFFVGILALLYFSVT